jgi:nicotinate-nucleotide pyrophosphorylase (carboxylating)
MLANFLQEDIGAGDITSNSVIPNNLVARAEIICKSGPAVVSGLEEAAIIFDICNCRSKILIKDGSSVKKGATVMKVSGNARAILKAERVALNMIMRMSGIATETKRMADIAGGVTILATRKTAPGLRHFDKKAVTAGGGRTHRMRLDDMVLIKDNHLALAGSVKECVTLAKKYIGSTVKTECETRNLKEVLAAISADVDVVMLDNFSPKQAADAIKQIVKMGLRKKAKLEISGGVNAKNIRRYAQAGPDFISLGYITHSPKAVDFSLEVMK